MARLQILCYPDPRLHKVAQPVANVDERVRRLVDDMLETMYAAEGVGLAATQVDVHERVIVIDTSPDRNEPRVLINPEIVWASEERAIAEEGCLSVPSIYDKVERAARVRVAATGRDGERREFEADGGLRRVPQPVQARPHPAEDGQAHARGRACRRLRPSRPRSTAG